MKSRRKKALARLQGNQAQVNDIESMIIKIMALALQVNKETEYCVFVSLQGHVDWIDFSIRESEENYENHLLDVDFVKVKGDDRFKDIIYQLEHILEFGTLDDSALQERHGVVGYTL
ncbi:hypothetical protein [Bacillus sp. NPDC094106]|uniref:hypothetical protein n=1 Tax=Bacillus sp. NPDC094106 TaxID=3363949 RepID=UPI0038088A18